MRVMRKGFFAVLLGLALLCPPLAEAAIVTPMKVSAELVTGHHSNASIVWGKANYRDARFDAINLFVRGEATPLGNITAEDCRIVLRDASGDLTIKGGSYAYWNGSEDVEVRGEDRTFPLMLSGFWKYREDDRENQFIYGLMDKDSGHDVRLFRNVGVEPSAEVGLGGKTIVWNLPGLGISSTDIFPRYRSTREQLDSYVPYVVFKKDGAKITGLRWRVVHPDRPHLPLSLPTAQNVEVSLYEVGKNYYSGGHFYANAPLWGELRFPPQDEETFKFESVEARVYETSSDDVWRPHTWYFHPRDPESGDVPLPDLPVENNLIAQDGMSIGVMLLDTDIAASSADAMSRQPVLQVHSMDCTALGGPESGDRFLYVDLDIRQLADKTPRKGWIKLISADNAVDWENLYLRLYYPAPAPGPGVVPDPVPDPMPSSDDYREIMKVWINCSDWNGKSGLTGRAEAYGDKEHYVILAEVELKTAPVTPIPPAPAPAPAVPVAPVLPGDVPSAVESVVAQPVSVPKDAPIEVQNQAKEEAAKAFSSASGITSADLAIDSVSGAVTLSEAAAKAAAEKALERKIPVKVNPLPVLQVDLKRGSGGIAAIGLKVTGAALMQDDPSKIQLLKVTGRGEGEMLRYEPDASKYTDGCFSLLDANGTAVKAIEPGKEYVLSLFIKDGGKYDLNGKADGKVVDPLAVLAESAQNPEQPQPQPKPQPKPQPQPKPEEKPEAKSSGGGCDMGYGLLGLALAALALRRTWR